MVLALALFVAAVVILTSKHKQQPGFSGTTYSAQNFGSAPGPGTSGNGYNNRDSGFDWLPWYLLWSSGSSSPATVNNYNYDSATGRSYRWIQEEEEPAAKPDAAPEKTTEVPEDQPEGFTQDEGSSDTPAIDPGESSAPSEVDSGESEAPDTGSADSGDSGYSDSGSDAGGDSGGGDSGGGDGD